MQFKEQLRKHSNWTITAMTAGAVTVVAATGMALADGVGNRSSLVDQIQLKDRASVAQAYEVPANPGIIPGPIFFAGAGSSFDSPLDDTASVAVDVPGDANVGQGSIDASVSFDSPATAAPTIAPPVSQPQMLQSADSYDSPAYIAPAPAPAPVQFASVDPYDSPASVAPAPVQYESAASVDSYDSPAYVAPAPATASAPVYRAPVQQYDSPESALSYSVASFDSAASYDSPS